MKVRMRDIWIILFVAYFACVGCAVGGKLTPSQADTAIGAISTATGLLRALDGFYGDLVKMKLMPDYTVQATRALTMADQAAEQLRQIVAGGTVTDAQLNVIAGQVDGARAILRAK